MLPFICALSITLNVVLCVTACLLTNSVSLCFRLLGFHPLEPHRDPVRQYPVFIADMLLDPQRGPETGPFEEQLLNFIDEFSTASLTVITSKKGK